jgi:hypothetical protein
VTHDALGMLAQDAGSAHQRARGAAQIVNDPAADTTGAVERRLRLGKAVEGAGAAASEDKRIARELFLSANDLQRQRRQLEIAADALGPLLHRHPPNTVRRDVGPLHAHERAAPLRGQQRQLDERDERAVAGLGRAPHAPQFVIVENARALAGLGVDAAHAAGEGAEVAVSAGGKPVRDAAHEREHVIGFVLAAAVFDVVEQIGDVAALQGGKDTLAPERVDVLAQTALDVAGCAQSLGRNVALEPVLGDVLERVGLDRRRLDRGAASLDAPEHLARLLARPLDRQLVGVAERHP